MSKYFRYFPTVQHDLNNIGQKVALTNILRRFKIDSSVKNNLKVFHEYTVQAQDRPDTIAAKYYGDSGFAWLILLFNEIHDPIFDWPLFNNNFDAYIKGKYGSVAAAQAATDHYRKILTKQQTLTDGTIIAERWVQIDKTTYDAISDSSLKRAPSCYDVELEDQQKKRQIKILNKKYLPMVRDEVKKVIRQGI